MRALVVVAVLAASAVVRADAPKPWAAGVSDAEQTTALAIYKNANTEFEEARYAQALAMYRDAIKHWDHPAIRFNMTVCLVNLDQPLEAYEDLELALKYGNEPLGAGVYEQGLTYRKLLLAQLAKLEVTSKEPNAVVTLDGAALFTSPGHVVKLVAPGNHQIVATKSGFMTTTIPLVLVGGKATITDVTLAHIAPSQIVHRWSAWKPWALAGAGAALAITGGYLEWRSYDNYQQYNNRFQTSCSAGCGGPGEPPVPSSLESQRHRAAIENGTAIGMFVVGGAALVVGAVGIYLNQPQSTLEKVPAVAPVAGGAALVWSGAF